MSNLIRREHAITPTQQALGGALDIFVEGYRRGNAPQMLFGLSVLRSATTDQMNAAMQSNSHATAAEITAMLTA